MPVSKPVVHYPYGKPDEGVDVLWRVKAQRYATMPYDYDDDWGVTPPRLEAAWLPVTRRTPKGAWIDPERGWGDGGPRFVLLDTTRKKFACDTVEEAVISFAHRRRRQIRVLEGQLARAREELALTGVQERGPVRAIDCSGELTC